VPAQLGDHTVRAASTPVRDGKGKLFSLKQNNMMRYSQNSQKL